MYTNGCHLHKRASVAAFYAFFPFIDHEFEFTKCKRVLQCCRNCPLLLFSDEEKNIFATFLLSNFITTKIVYEFHP